MGNPGRSPFRKPFVMPPITPPNPFRPRAIVAFTQSGSTARLISKYRPSTEILGLTPSPEIVNRMALYWGVQPSRMQAISNVDELIDALEKLLLEQNQVEEGDNLIILTGSSDCGKRGTPV